MQTGLAIALMSLMAILGMGCDDASTGGINCTPNETSLCNCLLDGEVFDGVQACNANGSGYEACQCGGGPAPLSSSEEEEGGEEPAEEGGEEATDEGGEEVIDEGGEEATDEGGEESTDEGGEEATDEGGEEATDEGGEEATDEGGEEATDEGGEEATDEGGEEATDEGGEEGGGTLPNSCPDNCLELPSEVERYLCALEICYGEALTSADFSSPTGDDITDAKAVVNHFGNVNNDLSPKAGDTYGLLGTGPCLEKNHSKDLDGGSSASDPFSSEEFQTFDNVEFVVEMVAPEGAVGFAVDYVFFSVEYQEFVGSAFNDKFYIQLQAPQTTNGEMQVVNTTACSDPDVYHDFIYNDGSKGCFIAINTAFSEPCPDAPTNISGTGFECAPAGGGNDGSSTGWLTTSWPIQPGEAFTLVFHIHDTADSIFDSQVILDNFRFLTTGDFGGGGTTNDGN